MKSVFSEQPNNIDEDTEAYRREMIGTDCTQAHLETQQQNSDLLTPGSIIKCGQMISAPQKYLNNE